MCSLLFNYHICFPLEVLLLVYMLNYTNLKKSKNCYFIFLGALFCLRVFLHQIQHQQQVLQIPPVRT